ncbi:hypothetical protein FSARC_4072 [Fusarium sarcochroum]|uniref:Uncharacterized protein n=1 Tax=Fusarium sarcochroum TaxID=1208366 RepID=A0A8H4U2P1_9HYPO|nr:hypothetical protein FSARC_4072 [Fusarium sarcochroum]
MAPLTTRSIFFDLDNTLFDHYHSLRCAISAVQNNYPGLTGIETQMLADQYNKALQKAYNSYLDKEVTYEETESQKVKLFFGALGLPEPTLEDIKNFRAIYKPVYRANRRATPGSVETLARLRENGYQTAIITNGQVEDQSAKAKAIEIHHLVDRIITSEEAGYRKPDIRIFQYAMEQLGASPNTICMIGDSADSDIRGALDAQLTAILYSPSSCDSTELLFGQEVPVMSHMGQLLSQLGIATRNFHPQFELT